MLKAAVYARYSSDNQREESIEAQIRAITDFAMQNGYYITKTYVDEALSAKTDNRPQFIKMITDAKMNMFDVVICHKLDRFARNRYDSAFYKKALKDNGVRLISVLENFDNTPESIILESVLEGMAEYYSANLAREVMKGLKENALQCRHTGGKPPFGYNVVNKEYVINDREAMAVRKIFEMTIAGQSYLSVRKWLKENNFKTKYNSDFSSRSINEILKNEKYIGVYVYNKKQRVIENGVKKNISHSNDDIIRIENGVPSIVDKAIFINANEMLKGRNQRGVGVTRAKETYLLSGKLFCGECSGYMNGARFRGGSNKHLYVIYECSNRRQKKNNCIKKMVNRDSIENKVIDILETEMFSDKSINEKLDELEKRILGLKNTIPDDIKQFEAELCGINRQIDNMVSAIANGMFHPSMKAKMDELENQKELLTNRIDEAKREFDAISIPDRKRILSAIEPYKNLHEKSSETKRAVIEAFVIKATIYDDGNLQVEIDLSKLHGAEGS